MRRLIVTFIDGILLCSVAAAQQTQTGSIPGIVTLPGDEPLPGATVKAIRDLSFQF